MSRKSKTSPADRPTPLARWLDAAMQARGWSQHRTAEEAGVSQPRIRQILAGDSTSMDLIKRLAKALFMGSNDVEYKRFEAEAIRAAFPTQPDVEAPDWLDAAAKEADYGDFPTMFNDEVKAELRDEVVGVVGALIASKHKRM